MENLMEMAIAFRQYHIDVCKVLNECTHDMTTLQLNFVQQMIFRRHSGSSAKNVCDYAEKGLICAMPL